MTNTRSGFYPTRRVRAAVTVLLALILVCLLPTLVRAEPLGSPTGERGMYVTGNLSLGSYVADVIHLGANGTGIARPDSAVVLADVTVHNLLGPVSLRTSFRQPLYGSSFWNVHTQQFTADLERPLGLGTAFIHYERCPATGFEWGWLGYRVPFRL